MRADEGVKRKRGSGRETGGDGKTKSGAEWGRDDFSQSPFLFPVKHDTQYRHRAPRARAFTSIFKFNTPFNLQGHTSKKRMPPFTRGTYG